MSRKKRLKNSALTLLIQEKLTARYLIHSLQNLRVPADVIIFDGFKDMAEADLKELYDSLGLAMTFKDFHHYTGIILKTKKREILL